MTDKNPYQTSDANLAEARMSSDVKLAITGIKSLPAMAGLEWIKDAFNLFKMNPLIWIVIVVLWFVLNVVAQFVPIIGGLAMTLLYAVFIAGFLLGCAALERGERLEVGHLFAGFKSNSGSLIGLGVCYLAAIIIWAIIVGVLVFSGAGGLEIFADPESINPTAIFSSGALLGVLISLLLMIPIMMMFWFAPALISLGGVPLIESLKMSFSGCLKNILPMFIFGLIMSVLAVLASLPFFIGWLVLLPIGMAAFYTAYRSIYTD